MEYVYRALVAAQYTGQASTAAVQIAVDQITQLTGNLWQVESDDGQTLVLRETASNGLSATWAIELNQVVVIDPSIGIVDRLNPQQFGARYRRADVVAEDVLVRGLNSAPYITALVDKVADGVLIKGLNSPAFISALKTKLAAAAAK